MAQKFVSDNEYWPQVCIALAQVTFGFFWASIFLPIDPYKVFVLILNAVATVLLFIVGHRMRRK